MRHFLIAALLLLLTLPAAAQAPEPAAVTQLRRLLGADVQLSFERATATDVAGSAVLTAAVLRRQNETIRIAEARLEGLREDGIARLSLRGIAIGGGALTATLERLDLEGLTIRRQPGGAKVEPQHVAADLLRIEGWRSLGDTPVNIGAISIEGIGAGRVGHASMTGFELGAPAMVIADRLTIARVAYAGLDAADILSAIIAQRQPRRTPGRQSLEIEGMALSQAGAPVARISAVTLRGEISEGRPHTGAFALRGLEVMSTPAIAEWMQRLGYERLRADARMDATHDIAAQRLELTEFGISLSNLGEVSLAFAADGVGENVDAASAQSARLLSARLRYADLSLFQRWLRTEAARERIAEPALRQRLIQQSAAAMPGPRMADARNAVARFLRGEATVLELTSAPRAPLRMSMVTGKPQSSLDGWQNMFGLTLTAR